MNILSRNQTIPKADFLGNIIFVLFCHSWRILSKM